MWRRGLRTKNVTAVIHAHMPGAEAGNAIADVLYGHVHLSGRLPYTIAKERDDYPADVLYFTSSSTDTPQIYYNKKLFVDYRLFDLFAAKEIEPRFPIGYGLAYTNFSYSNLWDRWLQGKTRRDGQG